MQKNVIKGLAFPFHLIASRCEFLFWRLGLTTFCCHHTSKQFYGRKSKDYLQNGGPLKKEVLLSSHTLCPPSPSPRRTQYRNYLLLSDRPSPNLMAANSCVLLLFLMVLGSARLLPLREAQVEAVTGAGKTQTAGCWTVAPLRCLFSLSTWALQCVASGKPELLCVDSGLQRCAETYRDRRARKSCKSHSAFYDLASDVMQPYFYCILSVKTVTRRGEIIPTS